MKKTLTIVSLLVVALAFVPAVQAAPMITYTIEYAADNTFSVYMEASSGDNAGIVSFVVPLNPAAVVTVTNDAPIAQYEDGFFSALAGFVLLRSGENILTVQASQNTLESGKPIMYGVGQVAVDFTDSTAYEPDSGNVTGAMNGTPGPVVLIASGTYDPAAFSDINDWTEWLDMQSTDFGGGVFTGEMNQSTGAPVVNTDDLDIMVNVVPEPMTMTLLAIGGLGALIRRKRR